MGHRLTELHLTDGHELTSCYPRKTLIFMHIATQISILVHVEQCFRTQISVCILNLAISLKVMDYRAIKEEK